MRAPCRTILRQIADRDLRAVTNTEVVQEILYVMDRRGRRGRRAEGVRLVREVMVLVPELLPVTREVMLLAGDLMEAYPEITARDAVHAATMRANGLTRLVSADEHFDCIKGIVRIDPVRAVRG
jgi:predicted nucleic acid-binding protein